MRDRDRHSGGHLPRGLLLAAALLAGTPGARVVFADRSYEILYTSLNLDGHSIAAECNPGGGTDCPCSIEDVGLVSFETYGEVTSNVRKTNTWVNAIGFRKLIETLPNGDSIGLGLYRYSASVQLPVLPLPDIGQVANPQAVHLMIQLWDGRNALYPSNKKSLEGTIYWDLNPWTADFGKVKVYTSSLDLIDTGVTLPPDLEWHSFALTIDLESRRYSSVTVDQETVELEGLELAEVFHPDWGEEVALTTTTESLAAWPGEECGTVFTWTTRFTGIEFGHERTENPAAVLDPPPDGLTLHQSYPNAFAQRTWIPYRLDAPAHVTVTIFDIRGRLARRLEIGAQSVGAYFEPGRAACWDGRDDRGAPVPSGSYLFLIQAGRFSSAGRMLLLR